MKVPLLKALRLVQRMGDAQGGDGVSPFESWRSEALFSLPVRGEATDHYRRVLTFMFRCSALRHGSWDEQAEDQGDHHEGGAGRS